MEGLSRWPMDRLDDIESMLMMKGYRVVRVSMPGGGPFHKQPHQYLIVDNAIVVDPRFGDVLAPLPRSCERCVVAGVFVGTLSDLERVVSKVAKSFEDSFRKDGLYVPPWRTYDAMMSRWDPRCLSRLLNLSRLLLPLARVRAPRLRDDPRFKCLRRSGGGHPVTYGFTTPRGE